MRRHWTDTALLRRMTRTRLSLGDRIRRVPPAGLLAVPLALFMLGAYWDQQAYRDFDEHRQALAEAGGGVLFIMQPKDCGGLAGSLERVGVALADRDISVRGLMMPGRVPQHETQAVLAAANQVFPHFLVRNRTVTALAAWAGIPNTPVALVVDPSGSVAALVSISGLQPAVLVERLAARLSEGAS